MHRRYYPLAIVALGGLLVMGCTAEREEEPVGSSSSELLSTEQVHALKARSVARDLEAAWVTRPNPLPGLEMARARVKKQAGELVRACEELVVAVGVGDPATSSPLHGLDSPLEERAMGEPTSPSGDKAGTVARWARVGEVSGALAESVAAWNVLAQDQTQRVDDAMAAQATSRQLQLDARRADEARRATVEKLLTILNDIVLSTTRSRRIPPDPELFRALL